MIQSALSRPGLGFDIPIQLAADVGDKTEHRLISED